MKDSTISHTTILIAMIAFVFILANMNGGNIYADRMGKKGKNSGGSEGVRGTSEDLHIGRSGESTDSLEGWSTNGQNTVLHKDVLSEDDFTEATGRSGRLL